MILRVLAILIAIAGLADPAMTVSRPVRPSLTIAILETPSLALPYNDGTRRDGAYRSAEAIEAALRGQFDITVHAHSVASTADPCPQASPCVVISDGARPRTLDARTSPLGAVRVWSTLAPNVAIAALDTSPTTDLNARAAVDVRLVARGAAGATTTLEVMDAGIVVGKATHAWSQDATAESTATVRVEWAPLALGQRELRVVASTMANEATALDNEAMTAVSVVSKPKNVLIYEPQPSWASTFVRRALEGDRRFTVLTRAKLGPSHTLAAEPVPLQAKALELANVAVVVISSPQFLTAPETEALSRFARLRGGAVVLLLDAPPSGAIADLLSASGIERREAAPIAVGQLKASELIALRPRGYGTRVIASAGDAIIVATTLGRGNVVASGAVDAWRFRADGTRFDAFWRSLVADAAQATGERLELRLSRSAAASGELVDVDVEWRSIEEPPDPLDGEAFVRCGQVSTPIRLWPSGSRARFRGQFESPAPGNCVVTVTLQPLGTAAASLRVTDSAPGPLLDRDEISAAVAAHGGTLVDAGDEDALITELRKLASRQQVSIAIHPMRSAWWIVPFAACLGGEWLLRRRRGLR